MSVAMPRQSRAASSPPDFVALARARHAAGTDFVWLDSVTADQDSVSVFSADPVEVLQGDIFRDREILRAALQRGARDHHSGGLFGWIGFDGRFIFGYHDTCFISRHGTTAPRPVAEAKPVEPLLDQASLPIKFVPQMDKDTFCALVRRAQEYIAAGDIYQVNLSYPWLASWPRELDSLDFYLRLRAASPAPYGAFVNLAGTQVFSASPEGFLEMEGRRIVTRPIKGTRPRGATPERDRELAQELKRSAKERAELVMITDLERNDLGQVCEFGSVRVTGLLKLERYAQVQHLVSTVEGTLRSDVDHLDAFLACFPGGSISGAPKKRALEIIRELELHDRQLYTGAIGWFGFQGETRFSIAIRTAWREGDNIRFDTGAGIVADSDPSYEWDETRHKAQGLLRASATP
jgi:para-aminobenzoate synthetase component 1